MILAALLVLFASDSIVPKSWLVIEPVDKSGRRPLRPDAVFEKHLLARDAAPPQKDEVLRGESEKDCAWKEATAKDDGTLEGSIGWAYTAIDSRLEDVWMAKLSGASQLYVNGVGFVGDAYSLGFGGVPIELRKGRNDVYVGGVRGSFRLELWKPENRLFVASWDRTIADDVGPVRSGTAQFVSPDGVLVVNCSIGSPDFCLTLEESGTRHLESSAFDNRIPVRHRIVPLGIEKIAARYECAWTQSDEKPRLQFELPAENGRDKLVIEHTVKALGETRRSTFVSAEDDSVQEYAVRPASDKETAVVLSLHGAGVDCMGQINSYSSKPEFTIIAPTNRRQYGFDWQDWGRTNAYEALIAEKHSIPHALYLTGHSMGGHGTWNVAANDPDAFAAIAPSAGWSSFDSYGGRPKGELAERWQDADAASRTLSLLDNLVQIPTFILHGTADDNVPVSEAQLMEKALSAAGHPPQVHYQEGAGHWWDGDRAPGADCVDWPDIFELFRKSPPREPSPDAHFTTVDPGIDSSNGWITVLQLEQYGQPAEVKTRLADGTKSLLVETKNVRCLELGPYEAMPTKRIVEGTEFGLTTEPVCLVREQGVWKTSRAPTGSPKEKTPEFSGPFKRAFRRHFVLVYGTQGTPEENRELLERARCDGEIWWYRGNGRAQLVPDIEYLRLRRTFCNAILYGNADTNLVWKERIGATAPIQVHRGSLKLGEREWKGDGLVALAVFPSTEQGELFGLVGSTGAQGTRLSYTTAYFVSGVGYPDYTVFGPEVLEKGDGGVLAAGWFDAQWKLDGHGFLRPDAK